MTTVSDQNPGDTSIKTIKNNEKAMKIPVLNYELFCLYCSADLVLLMLLALFCLVTFLTFLITEYLQLFVYSSRAAGSFLIILSNILCVSNVSCEIFF